LREAASGTSLVIPPATEPIAVDEIYAGLET
jgi:hypothetical protein